MRSGKLLFSIILFSVFLGCVSQPNVKDFVKTLPDVKAFLESNPNAEIKTTFISKEAASLAIKKIRAECGEQMKEVSYWLVTIRANEELRVYLDEAGKTAFCIIKPGAAPVVPGAQYGCTGTAPTRQCNVSFGTGIQTALCSNGEWAFEGANCTNIVCDSGFQLNASNECQIAACQDSSTESCNVAHGTGQKTRTCTNGAWSPWSACLNIICESGYQLNASSQNCEQTSCPGYSAESCDLNNGTGRKSRGCNDGIWSDWSACQLTSCNGGYLKSENSCVPVATVCNDPDANEAGISTKNGVYSKSATSGYSAQDHNSFVSQLDYCQSPTKLAEYYCQTDGYVAASEIICPNACSEGKCNKECDTVASCNDNNPCTLDSCDETKKCQHSTINTCNNNDACCPSNCSVENDSDCRPPDNPPIVEETIIGSCPFTISSPGKFVLEQNLGYSGSGECIRITASDSTLDCSYHGVSGSGSGKGILLENVSNVSLSNCNIQKFEFGIDASNSSARLENISSYYNTAFDIRCTNSSWAYNSIGDISYKTKNPECSGLPAPINPPTPP